MLFKYILLIIYLSVLQLIYGFNVTVNEKELKSFVYLNNAQHFEDDNGYIGVGVKENEYKIDYSVDLLINFNKLNNEISVNKLNKNYKILKYDILFEPKIKRFGKFSGKFYKLSNGIQLKPKSSSWFYSSKHIGDFTIEFWMNPVTLSNGEVIFKRHGPVILNGNVSGHSGIICSIKNRRLNWSFEDIFVDPNNIGNINNEENILKSRNVYNISIESKNILKKNIWAHHAITYNSITGELKYIINGKTEISKFVTHNMKSNGNILIPRFYSQERSSLIIGNGYIGYLDDFMISKIKKISYNIANYKKNNFEAEGYSYIKQINPRKYIENEAIITSDIYDLKQRGSYLKHYKINFKTKEDNLIILQSRMSNNFFVSHTDEKKLEWKTLKINNIINLPDYNLEGRYFQWRAILKSNSSGEHTPILNAINFSFLIDYPPKAPIKLLAFRKNESIFLKWMGNNESDIKSYKIYYGKNKNQFIFINNPITVNIKDLESSNNPYYKLTGLESNTMYYFAITAIDKNNHESKPSKQVFIYNKDNKKTMN